jgi:ABC-type antimicrobial peptide transport system permease subunit
VGKTIGLDRMGKRGERDVYQIVGVVKDTKYNRLNEEPRPIGYFAGGQDAAPRPALRYVIQSENAPESLTSSLRSAVAGEYPDAFLEFRSLALEIHESLLQPRLVAVLSATFGGLALLLAVVGLYGATMYSVTRRKGEIGIRMAMGAQRSSVIWLMMRDSIALVTGGMILGAAASFAGGRLIGSLLFGVTAGAPEPLAVAAFLLMFAAAIAAYLPARRAARLDPMVALREE